MFTRSILGSHGYDAGNSCDTLRSSPAVELLPACTRSGSNPLLRCSTHASILRTPLVYLMRWTEVIECNSAHLLDAPSFLALVFHTRQAHWPAAESGASFSVLGPSFHRNSRACLALVQHFRALRCVHTCVPGVSITEPPILLEFLLFALVHR